MWKNKCSKKLNLSKKSHYKNQQLCQFVRLKFMVNFDFIINSSILNLFSSNKKILQNNIINKCTAVSYQYNFSLLVFYDCFKIGIFTHILLIGAKNAYAEQRVKIFELKANASILTFIQDDYDEEMIRNNSTLFTPMMVEVSVTSQKKNKKEEIKLISGNEWCEKALDLLDSSDYTNPELKSKNMNNETMCTASNLIKIIAI